MEYTQWAAAAIGLGYILGVLILIVMEYTQWAMKNLQEVSAWVKS